MTSYHPPASPHLTSPQQSFTVTLTPPTPYQTHPIDQFTIIMSSIRTTRFTSLLTRTVRAGPTRALVQRPISTLRTTSTRPAVQFQPSPLQRIFPTAGTRLLASASGGTSGKRDADLLVDELQELYFPFPFSLVSQFAQANETK